MVTPFMAGLAVVHPGSSQVNLQDLAGGQPPSVQNISGLPAPHDPTIYGYETACAGMRKLAEDLKQGIQVVSNALGELENNLRFSGKSMEATQVMQTLTNLQKMVPDLMQQCGKLEQQKNSQVQRMQGALQTLQGNLSQVQ